MKDFLANLKQSFLREFLWLFGALIVALLLSTGLRELLEISTVNYERIVQELHHNETTLKVLLFVLCLVGIYLTRLVVAAVSMLADTATVE
ncbi:hypothetical protein [Hymenobacter cellulosivorans]|uniref:Uncharacterized protein n=1 Tax=Hymenobacter cellulosivorans TaxID=2932249 RepID=A0ABY4F5Y9_9BACT|nr:hypothetical protein [Hymenobacter cellulosivorans]UOQ52088.1 hypothetical protein MUN80_20285 [Hymenobacter cellulosivorans]